MQFLEMPMKVMSLRLIEKGRSILNTDGITHHAWGLDFTKGESEIRARIQ